MNTFFITGLPRSRTAWLANFFTYKNSFCFHELSKFGSSTIELIEKMKSRDEMHVGTSDCGFPFYYEKMLKIIPDSKVVIINRPFLEVRDSLMNFCEEWNDKLEHNLYLNEKYLKDLAFEYDCFHVDYMDLNNGLRVKKMWEHIFDNISWDHDRWNQLEETKVEIIKSKWLPKVDKERLQLMLGV